MKTKRLSNCPKLFCQSLLLERAEFKLVTCFNNCRQENFRILDCFWDKNVTKFNSKVFYRITGSIGIMN